MLRRACSYIPTCKQIRFLLDSIKNQAKQFFYANTLCSLGSHIRSARLASLIGTLKNYVLNLKRLVWINVEVMHRKQLQFRCILNLNFAVSLAQKKHDPVRHLFGCVSRIVLLNMEILVMLRFVCSTKDYDPNLIIQELQTMATYFSIRVLLLNLILNLVLWKKKGFHLF